MYRHWDRKGTPPSEFHSSDDEMKRLAMENAFKSHVLRQLAKSDPEIGACQKAVSFSIQAARGRMVNATMPTTLLSDLFDVITLDHCQLLFECVEQNVALWKEEMFFVPVKNNILRICNGAHGHRYLSWPSRILTSPLCFQTFFVAYLAHSRQSFVEESSCSWRASSPSRSARD